MLINPVINVINTHINSCKLNKNKFPASNCDGNDFLDFLTNMSQINKVKISFSGINKVSDDFCNHKIENYTGCLIGGAIGDAIGAPIEFDRFRKIKKQYGNDGISDLITDKNGISKITDDTQMTMFTAFGLVKSLSAQGSLDVPPNYSTVYNSYKDWYKTQNEQYSQNNNSWLMNLPELYSRKSPGITCISALKSGIIGEFGLPVNTSKGNGGVMRVAPVGLMYYKNPKMAFEIGARLTAMTHGSPDAYLPAGMHSAIIAYIIQGYDMKTSILKSLEILKTYNNHENTEHWVKYAVNSSENECSSRFVMYNIVKSPTADRTLAASLYCCLKNSDNYQNAVLMAVNHDGDSDTIGSITGNIMGAYLGESAIPQSWKNSVQLNNELKLLSQDLFCENPADIEDLNERYSV